MNKAVLKEIAVEYLVPGQFQPRQKFCQTALNELANSIKAQGLIEPLVVRPHKKNIYEIIAGERRWRAAQIARLDTVPCLIRDYTDQQAAAVSVIENVQRENLNPIEEAQAYFNLIEEFQFYHEEVANMVGKSRSHVSNALRILELDKKIQQALVNNEMTLGHAKVLVGLEKTEQLELLEKIQSLQWSVRRVEAEVKKIKQRQAFTNPRKDKDIGRLEELISEQCGAQARIESSQDDGGWLKIKFYNNDTLAGLLDKLGVEYHDV